MLSKRERIVAWAIADAQRRAEAEAATLARVTARLKSGPGYTVFPVLSASALKVWTDSMLKTLNRPSFFGTFIAKGMSGDEVITDPFS